MQFPFLLPEQSPWPPEDRERRAVVPWVIWRPRGAAYPPHRQHGSQGRLLILPLWKCFNSRIKYCFALCPAAQHHCSVIFHKYNKPPEQTGLKHCFQTRLDKEQASSSRCSGQFIALCSASAPPDPWETELGPSNLQLTLNWVNKLFVFSFAWIV